MNILDFARRYRQAGINLLPVKHDGTKAPAAECLDETYSWKYLQSRPPTDEEMTYFFSNGNGIAGIGGRISGNLEDFDFDDVAVFEQWKELIVEHLGQEFWERLLIVLTPRPGRAVITRCPDGVEGSQKLALRPNPNYGQPGEKKFIGLAETKAEGGYFLLPGCPPACHETGRTYHVIQGSFDAIPELTSDEREILLSCARSFDEMPRTVFETPSRESKQDEILPGQDFEQRGPSIETLIQSAGWKLWKSFPDKKWWTRPGKQSGPSGSTNGQYFYPFTTSTEFDANRAYGKFAVFAILDHAGDFSAAAKALYAEGYGTQHESKEQREARENQGILNAVNEAAKEDAAGDAQEHKESAFVVPSHWRWLDVANRRDWNCAPLRWTVQDLIAQGNFVIVAAETQTGKTLFGLFLAHSILHDGQLFGRLNISPVDKVLYMGLEDPDRRFDERLGDIEHSFPAIKEGRFIVHTAPSFTLTDEKMVAYLENLIVTHGFKVVFLDTYQKATPGLTSFDDEKQSVILQRLSNLTRKLNVSIIVLDHVRKRQNGTKRADLSIDDIKGTGGKPQNADCIILVERTPDRKQAKLQSFSKDSDSNIRMLLDISPRGSTEDKFKYAGDLDELGKQSKQRANANREKVLAGMSRDWMSAPMIAKAAGFSNSTVQTHIKELMTERKVEDNGMKNRYRCYRLSPTVESGDSIGDSAIEQNL